MTNDQQHGAATRPKRNWWKPAFFVALIAFEIAREAAVLNAATGVWPNTSTSTVTSGSRVQAQGSWMRVDGGEELAPNVITIQCHKSLGSCIEANTPIRERYVFPADLDWFPARFTGDAVSYENTYPICVSYTVRIDLKLGKAFSVREKKKDAPDDLCEAVEQRMEMHLGDPKADPEALLKGHFVPIISAFVAVSKAFE